MEKKEWSKKDRKLLAGIILLTLLIIAVLGGLFVYHSQRGSKDVAAVMAEDLKGEDFSSLSGEEERIRKATDTAVSVLETLPTTMTREERIQAVGNALLESGLGLSEKETAELAEWLVDYYSNLQGSTEIVTGGDSVQLEKTLVEQIQQDLTSIYDYLSQLDETVINNKEEILNLTTVQEGSFDGVNQYLEFLKSTINGLQKQFTEYEANYSSIENTTTVQFGSINLQLESISENIENTKAEINENIHTSDAGNAERYESLNSTVNNFASSLREDLESVNKNISKIISELQKDSAEQNKELTEKLTESHEELLQVIDTMDQKWALALEQIIENLTAEIEESHGALSDQLSGTKNALSEEAAMNKAEISGQLSDSQQNLTNEIIDSQDTLSKQLNDVQKSLSEEAADYKAGISGEISESEKILSDKIKEAQDKLQLQIISGEKNISDKIEAGQNDINSNMEKSKNELSSEVNSAKENISSQLTEELKSTAEKINNQVDKSEKEITSGLTDSRTQLQSQLSGAEKTLTQGIDSGVSLLLTNLDSVHADITLTQNEIKGILNDMDAADEEKMTDIVNRFAGVNNKLAAINSAMDTAHNDIKGLISSLQSSTEENQEKLLEALTAIDSSFSTQNSENFELLVNSMQTQTETVQNWFNSLNSSVTSNFETLSDTVTGIEQSAAQNKEEVLNNFNQSFMNLSAAVENIGQVVTDSKDDIINRISSLEISTTDSLNKLSNDVQSVFQRASNGKQLLASALLAKNVTIKKDATFKEVYDAILSIDQQIVIGVEQVPGTITYDYHYHSGDPDNGGGCYTKQLYHQHGPECYSKAVCTVRVQTNGGFFSEGDDWCPCHGNVHKIKQNVIRKHSSCGAADNYGQISFTEHHGPGTDGFKGYDSSTHSYDKLSCGKTNATFVGWDVGCGMVNGQIIGAYIVYDPAIQSSAPVAKLMADKIYVPKRYDDYVLIPNSGMENWEEEETESEIQAEEEAKTIPEELMEQAEPEKQPEETKKSEEIKEREETKGTEEVKGTDEIEGTESESKSSEDESSSEEKESVTVMEQSSETLDIIPEEEEVLTDN
ncbi:hypothetical protein [Eisenbergiella tayi]|uniref:hypothetical protein n=1 Tax=Eisenbergiella tayi TaxID=1432052 RepID=UPI0008496556|nr:hypothetical protein [Eisenbergiella tayi]ODR28302.1 hypothetical protein BEI60_31220 [Eisenbergiella tayi]